MISTVFKFTFNLWWSRGGARILSKISNVGFHGKPHTFFLWPRFHWFGRKEAQGPSLGTRWFQLLLLLSSMKAPKFQFFCPHFRETNQNSNNNQWNQVTKKMSGFLLKPRWTGLPLPLPNCSKILVVAPESSQLCFHFKRNLNCSYVDLFSIACSPPAPPTLTRYNHFWQVTRKLVRHRNDNYIKKNQKVRKYCPAKGLFSTHKREQKNSSRLVTLVLQLVNNKLSETGDFHWFATNRPSIWTWTWTST